jgi:hypothetical protein
VLDERGRQVGRGHDGTRSNGVEGDVSGPAAEVEPLLALPGSEAIHEGSVHVGDQLCHVLERRRAPDGGVTLRQLFEGHVSPLTG